jgi:hypothetical protein
MWFARYSGRYEKLTFKTGVASNKQVVLRGQGYVPDKE